MLNTLNEVDVEADFKKVLNKTNKVNRLLNKPSMVNRATLEGLSHFQKTLMITDGTVTELLEYYLNEGIKVEKLYEEVEASFSCLPISHSSVIEEEELPVLLRKVLLQGTTSLNNWLYAESSILIDNLPEKFRHDLLVSQKPIGKLWAQYRLETYKSDFTVQKEKATDKIASYFNIPVNSDILSRTYCVYSFGRKTMIITEKFSTKNFLD